MYQCLEAGCPVEKLIVLMIAPAMRRKRMRE